MDNRTDLPDFYLVQRLTSRPTPGDPRRGFDAHFYLDYMGSSEFEWGAIPAALRRMREAPAVVEEASVEIAGKIRDVFFVGHEGVARFAVDMELWASGSQRRRPFSGKEWTRFPEALEGSQDEHSQTDAWWDIKGGLAWAIDRRVADKLANAFNSRPAKD